MAATRDSEAEAPQEAQRVERLRVLDLSAVGLAFPIALLLGYFGGRAIGGWLGSAQLGGMIGALVGIVAGFYNLFKMVSRLAPRRAAGTAAAAAPVARNGDEPPGPELPDDDEADLELLDDNEALDALDDAAADSPEDSRR